MMKICFFADGKTIHTQRWVNYFVDKGYEVSLISSTPYRYKSLKFYLLKSYTNNRYFNFLGYCLQINKIINKIKPDIIHSHYATIYGFFGALSNFHPLVVSVWGSDVLVEPKKSRILKGLTQHALKKADLITCDGENTKNATIELGINIEKIKIIYHGVDTKKFKANKKDKKFIKNLFGGNFPIVISIRTLRPIYNVETLIRAIPLILKKIPKVKFIIAGKGEQKKYLMNLAKSLCIFNAIRFTGAIPHNDLPKYLASSDVYVSTSLSDGGIAVSTLEAMACELAPVVTDIGDNKKWIKDGENGFIIPIKNPKKLAEKIIYLLENKDIRKKFGEINRKIIKEKQNYYKEMEKMETLYKKLIR
ncbi:MAG: glycosyltransferase family 4 protein [Candidatus Aenigmarchaeota archaeon]|nr:glycosyltransferase family 4 protein [Candidatus Aenigmarchaeota archaeon]